MSAHLVGHGFSVDDDDEDDDHDDDDDVDGPYLSAPLVSLARSVNGRHWLPALSVEAEQGGGNHLYTYLQSMGWVTNMRFAFQLTTNIYNLLYSSHA